MTDMAAQSVSEEERDPRFIHPEGVGWPEYVENYRPGGFHPVHINDDLDDGRYRIMHKLGHGESSTVWLARDKVAKKWVALKIVDAKRSTWLMEQKSALLGASLGHFETQYLAMELRHFEFEGPNGRHVCLVLPVLGPSTAELSDGLGRRLKPETARQPSFQAAAAVAELHSLGFCHGNVSTEHLLLSICNVDDVGEDQIYQMLGRPTIGLLETESGEQTGPEAPRYIVKRVDFMALPHNIMQSEIRLIDFERCFPTMSPPAELLDEVRPNTAPEVVVGHAPSAASDVWSLGCCVLRVRSGESEFSPSMDANTPQVCRPFSGRHTRKVAEGLVVEFRRMANEGLQ
ncbi:kinase-like protein [Sarocladium strictum]